MNLRDLIGQRALLKVDTTRGYSTSIVDEYKILEVSPSGNWVKLMTIHGLKFWRAVSEVSFVEHLITPEIRPLEDK